MDEQNTQHEETKKSEPSLANKVGREATVAAATTLAGLGTLYVTGLAVSKIQNFRARRAEKNAAKVTPIVAETVGS